MAEIIPKVIVELPYVTGRPDPTARPDQRTLQYIQNGECIEGGDYSGDPSGTLNRPAASIQKNVATLLENDKIINASVYEVIQRVNAHDKALGNIGDENLANKVESLESDISPIPSQIIALQQKDFILGEDIDKLEETLGTKPIDDDTTRKLLEDVTWVKKELGSYAGFNFNGLPDADSMTATGIKHSITVLGQGINKNKDRINKLEYNWQESDVGNLQNELNEIRHELGTNGDGPLPNLFQWSKNTQDTIGQMLTQIDLINHNIGEHTDGTLNERIEENKINIEKNEAKIVVNTQDIVSIKGTIGTDSTPTTLSYRLKDTEDKTSLLNQIVGTDATSGLQSVVATLAATVGDNDTNDTIIYRLNTVESDLTTSQNDISEINNKLGNNTPGSETGYERRIKELENKSRRSFGGFKINSNSDVTAITTTGYSDISIATEHNTSLPEQVDFEVSGTSIEYKGKEQKTFDMRMTMNLSDFSANEVIFTMFRKRNSIETELISQTVYPKGHVHSSFPVRLQKNDQVFVKVKSGNSALTEITVREGAIYLSQIS